MRMKLFSSKSVRACLIVYFICLVAYLSHVFFFTDIQDFLRSSDIGTQKNFSEGWTLDTRETVDICKINAGDYGGTIVITKKLPDNVGQTDSVCFSTSNLRLKAYVDDDLIYSFDTRENLTGKGYGVAYHMLGLGPKDSGRTMRIEAQTVFFNMKGGTFNDMIFGQEPEYRYYVMRKDIMGFNLALLMVIFGVVLISFYLGMYRENSMMRSLWALGLSAILFGMWSLSDTGIPQLMTGSIFANRELVYGALHLAEFPMIIFVNSITRPKRRIYLYLSFFTSIVSFGILIFTRYVLGMDMHVMVGVIYFSYITELIWMIVMLADNEIYCRKNGRSSKLRYFYIGAMVFVATSFIDMARYLFRARVSVGQGSWFRFGLVIFFIFMAFQIFDWWASEKTSLERDRFINRLLQYVMGTEDPESRINKVLEYLCNELHADRAYIFEDMRDGTFDNTYEYCAEGVTPEIDNLKGLPFEGVVDAWYSEYEKGGHILIYDLEKYREVSENMYQVLKPQGINTLVTGPLILEGKYIGFFGVGNPPPQMMTEISEIIRLLMFFLSEMVSQRDAHKRLMDYSYHDALTGVGNRRAIREFEREELDTSRPYGFIMFDINGLKAVNDSKGHDAGDDLIMAVASCITEVFGSENVYRMGGDEFAVYVYEDTKEEFERKIEKVRNMVSEKGAHVAIGYSFADAGDPDYNAHRVDADNRMYDEKREYYRGGHDRRARSGD